MNSKTADAAAAIVVVAITSIVTALGLLAIKAGEAKTKMLASFSAMSGGAAQGQAVLDLVEKLGPQVGQTTEQLGAMAQKLLAAGVASNKLEAQLRAVAASGAITGTNGEKMASIFAKLAEQGGPGVAKLKFALTSLAGTGVTEADFIKALGITPKAYALAKKAGTLTGTQISDALTKALNAKGKGPLETQANSLSAIWANLVSNVTKLFDEVTSSAGYKQFTAAFKDLAGIFGSNNAAGKAMKTGITGAFSAIFSAAAKALPYIKLGIEKVIILALKAYIAFKQWQKGGQQLNGQSSIFTKIASAATVAWIAIKGLSTAFITLVSWGAKLFAIGQQIDDGLAKGITAGTAKVLAAIKGLGTAAMGALKGILGIASPSRVFAQLGAHTAAGFTQGIRGGTGGVQAASAGMAAGAIQGAAGAQGKPGAPGGGGGKKGGSSITVNVASGAIQLGGGGATGASELTEIALSAMIERIALSQGLGGAGG